MTDAPFGHQAVITLLNGDRPLHTDRLLFDAANAIAGYSSTARPHDLMRLDTLLAWGVHLARYLPSLGHEAWLKVSHPFATRSSCLNGVTTTEEACAAIHERIATWQAADAAAADGTAVAQLRELVDAQAAEHPRLGLSFGYIGNCSLGGGANAWDDRSWRVFAKLATPTARGGCNVSFGGVPTGDIGRLMLDAERRLAAWCDAQEHRLDDGEIARVGETADA